MLLERLRDSLNCNIESHPQTQDESQLDINNKKVDPENNDNSSLISSTALPSTSSIPAPSPSSDNELPDEDNLYAPRSCVEVAVTMDKTSDRVTGERSSEYAFSNDPSPHPSQTITSTLSSNKAKIKAEIAVKSKHNQNNSAYKEQFMMTWLKRKLSPEKEADSTNTTKHSRSDR